MVIYICGVLGIDVALYIVEIVGCSIINSVISVNMLIRKFLTTIYTQTNVGIPDSHTWP